MQDLVVESFIHLRKLKNKKIQNKKTNLFNCLVYKEESIEKQAPQVFLKPTQTKQISHNQYKKLKRIEKFKKRIITYDSQYRLSGLLTTRQVRRYKIGCELQGIEIPEHIKELYEKYVGKMNVKKKEEKKKRKEARRAKKKLKPSKSNKYSEYITSALWEKRKNALFQEFPRICIVCSSARKISVHHLKYDSREFGSEKNEDLAIVCWPCHEEFHKKYGVKRNCHEDFNKFIEEKKNMV